MAKNVILNLKIDTKDGVRSIGDVNKEVKTTLKTLSQMEDASEGINAELRGTEIGTKEYKKLRSELVKVNKELKNQELAFEALDAEQLTSTLKGAIGGVADLGSGIALLGLEGDNIDELVQKIAQIEGAQRLVTGSLEAYTEGLKFARNSTVLQTLATNALSTAQGIYTAVVGTSTGALKSFKLALLGTGVGAIIFAVYKLIEAFTDLGDETKTVKEETVELTEEQKKLQEAHEDDTKQLAENTSGFFRHITALKQTNAGSKERKKLINQINGTYGTTIQNLKDETLFQNQLNIAIDTYIASAKQKILLIRNDKKVTEQLTKQIEAEEKLIGIRERLKKAGINEEDINFEPNLYTDVLSLVEIEFINATNIINDTKKALEELGAEFINLGGTDNPQKSGVSNVIADVKELEKTIDEFDIDLPDFAEEMNVDLWAEKTDEVNASIEMAKELFGEINGEVFEITTLSEGLKNIFSELDFNDVLFAAQAVTQAIESIFISQAESRKEQREAEYNADAEGLKASLADREITQKQYDDKLRALNKQKTAQERLAKVKEFNQNKALGITNATINTATAITRVIPNPFLMALAGAIGATQIGLIASQRLKLNKGGLIGGQPSNVDTVPAQLARGESVINSTSTSLFAPLLSAINQIGGGVAFAPNVSSLALAGGSSNNSVYSSNNQQQVVKAYVVESELSDVQRRVKRYNDGSVF